MPAGDSTFVSGPVHVAPSMASWVVSESEVIDCQISTSFPQDPQR